MRAFLLGKSSGKTVGVGLCLAVLVAAAGCGGDSKRAEKVGDNDNLAYFVDTQSERGSSVSWITNYTSPGEALPNTSFLHPDGTRTTPSDAVVVGRVAKVNKGYGWVWPDGADDAPSGIQAKFDHPRAVWKTVHLDLMVEGVVAGRQVKTFRVGMAIDGDTDFEKFAAGIQEMGSAVWFLVKASPVFDYDQRLWSVVEGGAMIARLGSDGSLSFDLLEASRNAAYTGEAPTLDALQALADAPGRVIQYDATGARVNPPTLIVEH